MTSNGSKHKEIFLQNIGGRIKAIREAKGLSQFQLGIESEVPKNQIGRIERGEINTSIYTLKRLADALKVEVSSFFS